MSAIGRRRFLSLIACIPGFGWLRSKPESIDQWMAKDYGFVAEPKCYQMVKWIHADFETPPFMDSTDEMFSEEGGSIQISPVRRSIGVLVFSKERGVEVGRYIHFKNSGFAWFVGGREINVTHWAMYPAGPHEAFSTFDFRSYKDAHEAYEGALNLFLGPPLSCANPVGGPREMDFRGK